jgi:hypothetical protein
MLVQRKPNDQFSAMCVVLVTEFRGSTSLDVNNKPSVMLQVASGEFPQNRTVLSGTVAEMSGFEVGKAYQARVHFRGIHKVYGDDYVWTNFGEITEKSEIAKIAKEIPAKPFVAWEPEGKKDAYQRKGNAVESARSKQIRDGNYIPAGGVSGTGDHRNASKIIEGDSLRNLDERNDLSEEDLEKALNGTKKTVRGPQAGGQ